MECEYCNKVLSSKSSLKYHQKTAKYCLEKRGITKVPSFSCSLCNKKFTQRSNLKTHKKTCRSIDSLEKKYNKLQKEYTQLQSEHIELKSKYEIIDREYEQLKIKHEKLSLTTATRTTTSNKIQINNYIQQMKPITDQDLINNVPNLTLEYHARGAEGYADYALEFPFKGKIVTVDVSRNKIKYKNADGDVIEDAGFRKMMRKLCTFVRDRSFDLSKEYEEKMGDEFTEKDLEKYDFLENAVAIAKYAAGRETEFCNKIIKLISSKAKI